MSLGMRGKAESKGTGVGASAGVFFLLALLAQPALAAPRVMLTPQGPREAGELRDGELLARGRVEGADGDVRVWLRNTDGETPSAGHYVLSGAVSPHQLRVRLEVETDTASPDTQGIRVTAAGRPVTVRIVADGRQRVAPDRYAMALMATPVPATD